MPISFKPLWESLLTRGIAEEELSEKASLSPYYVSLLKDNESVPSHILGRICGFLGCPLSEIAEYIPEPDSRAKILADSLLADLSALRRRVEALEQERDRQMPSQTVRSLPAEEEAQAAPAGDELEPDRQEEPQNPRPADRYGDYIVLRMLPSEMAYPVRKLGKFVGMKEAAEILGISPSDSSANLALRMAVHLASPTMCPLEALKLPSGKGGIQITQESVYRLNGWLQEQGKTIAEAIPGQDFEKRAPRREAYSNSRRLNSAILDLLGMECLD